MCRNELTWIPFKIDKMKQNILVDVDHLKMDSHTMNCKFQHIFSLLSVSSDNDKI